MSPWRRPSRLFLITDALLTRCNRLISAVYILLVSSLICAAAYLYFSHIHALVAATLPPPRARLHTAISLYLLFSVASNYFTCLCTFAGSPPTATDPEASPTALSAHQHRHQLNHHQLQHAQSDGQKLRPSPLPHDPDPGQTMPLSVQATVTETTTTTATLTTTKSESACSTGTGSNGGGGVGGGATSACANGNWSHPSRPPRPPSSQKHVHFGPSSGGTLVSAHRSASSTITRSETWRFCDICRSSKPPRTHHCTTCGVCILRLCHHCPALGRCVGRDNYPYFFRFVVSAAVGSAYAAGTALWLRGATQRGADGMLFAFMIGAAATTVAAGMLAAWHCYLAMTAQTTVEWLENFAVRRARAAPQEWGRWSGPFSKGVVSNLREAFGNGGWRRLPWWFTLLLPVRRIPAVDHEAW